MTIEVGNVIPFGGAIGAGGGDGVKFEVVTELPQEGRAGIIYLLQVDGAEAPNKCEEYIWLKDEGRYEEFGPTTATPDKEGIIKFDPDSLVINDDGQLTVDGYTDLKAKVDDLELFKFPNATIVGEPLINNGQIANFSTADYLMFPFELDVRDHAFTVEFAFTTGADVTTQQNVIDSRFGIALAIKNGLGLMAVSYNGTSWGTTGEGVMAIQPNTTYYAKLSWNKLQYKTLLSTNGRDYVEDISFTSATGPFPATIFIGGGSTEALGHAVHPFGGTINLNKAYLYIDNQLIWQGMDDVGLATRLDVELGNITSAGIQAIQNIVGNPYSKTEIDEQMEEKQDKLIAGPGINLDTTTNIISSTGGDGDTISTGKYYNSAAFDVIGSPTITVDGIASGFSSANGVSILNTIPFATLDVGKTYTFKSNVTFSSDNSTTQYLLLLGNCSIYLNQSALFIQYNNYVTQIYDTGYNQHTNKNVDITAVFDLKNNKLAINVIDTLTGEILTDKNANISVASQVNLSIARLGQNGNMPFNGQIGLKQFSIEVDGKEVFSGSKKLINAGYLDGTLTECTVLVESYINGTSGYRTWSDGYCEQWGHFDSSTTVQFLKAFRDTNYTLLCSASFTSASSNANAALWGSKGTTGFQAVAYPSYGTSGCDWRACGYLAEGEY